MKFYFVLLTLLHIARVLLVSVPTLVARPVPDLFTLNHLGDIALFTLCLVASYEHGFSRTVLKSMNPARWRMAGQATLALGVFQVFLYTMGERIGAPDLIPNPGILDVARLFLPYALFAIPAIVHSHELAKTSQS
ncbi:MAG: hypothetical protein AB1916_15340 [Thermodesulfobacteriota bacterium]